MRSGGDTARLILICGLPGSGKTTLAKRLAENRSAIRLCPDEWQAALRFDPFDDSAHGRIESLMWQMAQELFLRGLSVILAFGFWGRSERDEKRERARELGVPVELHYLDVPMDELLGRLEARHRQRVWGAVPVEREHLERYAQVFQPPDSEELSLFDCVAPEIIT
ncbi:MAG: ATP-binding protein [Candidatus Dormiibacterota bacterium]